ncbi:lysophospholipid acyltransferase family protein [Coraliomargarita sp. SDUM461004]|uniref:Lysophospholipid acyltransferase family protein n=1 Tax=Thalassobacterium sedimentorum TaxID=3041258 RepID=A0ABU1AHL2_9BACT|nr:lysophospholipid acyltransferase family protein [Coraliomargarita sp. SDUM461004]MDQ8194265.1 lysophospholipid acyltransferase family protein [Coraliomargarita sp. SDUM461004]
MEPKLIDLQGTLAGVKMPKLLSKCFAPGIERMLGINGVNRIYADVHSQLDDIENDEAFFMKTLRVMGVHFELDNADFERIPKTGSLIVIANHPFGGVDGVVMGALLKGVRQDAKLMGNYLLAHMEGIRGSIIQVDPFGGEASSRANLKGMRDAIRLLRDGGCLGAFPAGEVSSLRLKSGAVVDPLWTGHIVNLALKTGAKVLPIYFEGCNSALFQAAGLLHPRLRTALLAREFSRARGREMRLKVGAIIEPKHLETFETKEAATEYLRLKTYALKEMEPKQSRRRLRLPFRSATAARTIQPLAPAQLTHRLEQEIESLPALTRLVEHGDFEVYCVSADKIPLVLKEIGRLREETFRAVEEGTGQASDLDEFDHYYLHLFMWNRAEREIVGAYRIGLADEIVKEYGKQGLYTSTLFHYRARFLEKLGPAIELGRSFICIKYQKKHASLALIWRGIGEFVARNPQYRTLFGPVSITDAYNSISKDLMVHFFREHSFDEELSQYVKARNSPKSFKLLKGISLKHIGEAIKSVDSVSAIVSGFEEDRKGVPILLRHYLKLNGVLLSFNVDPAFSDVIDGLILVDLCKTDPKVLQRYLGKEGYGNFKNYHAQDLDVEEVIAAAESVI